ncbi:hypothetical protein CKAH01_05988 [Colletotrichum kahawae]|uniref:Uncharacterized protein n=1 Tax=Colletotrichum kahawae TaxID=34407 RepID=A0AAE0D523_COLKA|nr:hypothetical protein CKAH01_05988 [Colletotrichum kahawae]
MNPDPSTSDEDSGPKGGHGKPPTSYTRHTWTHSCSTTPDFPRSTAGYARDSLGQPGPIGNDKRPTTTASSSSSIDNHQRQTLQAAAAAAATTTSSARQRHRPPSARFILLALAARPKPQFPKKQRSSHIHEDRNELAHLTRPISIAAVSDGEGGGNGGEATPAVSNSLPLGTGRQVLRTASAKDPARMYMAVASTEAGLSAAAIATRCQSPRAPEPGFQVTIQVQRQAQVQVRCNGRRVFNCPPGLVSTEEAWVESIRPSSVPCQI